MTHVAPRWAQREATEADHPRALLLTQRFSPARSVAAVRWSALVDHLAPEGIDVRVICHRYPGDGLGHDDRVVLEIPRGAVRPEVGPNDAIRLDDGSGRITLKARAMVQARRLSVLPTSSISWFRRWREVLAVVDRVRPDVIVSTSPPHDLHAFAVVLARKVGLPLVIDFRDPYVDDARYDRPRLPPWRQAIRALERWYVRSARSLLTAGATHLEELRARYPDRGSDFHHVPNGFHPSDGSPSAIGERDGDDDPIELGVVASAPAHELEVVVRGARLAWPDRSIRLHSFGLPEDALAPLRSLVEVVSHGWLSPTELGQALDVADVLLLVLSPSRAAGGGTSTKLYQYLERARPILAVNPCDADVPLLERWSTHRIVRDPSESDAARALAELATTGPVIDATGFADTYGWPHLAGLVADVIRRSTDVPARGGSPA